MAPAPARAKPKASRGHWRPSLLKHSPSHHTPQPEAGTAAVYRLRALDFCPLGILAPGVFFLCLLANSTMH